jgi:hypothetical protein
MIEHKLDHIQSSMSRNNGQQSAPVKDAIILEVKLKHFHESKFLGGVSLLNQVGRDLLGPNGTDDRDEVQVNCSSSSIFIIPIIRKNMPISKANTLNVRSRKCT